MGDKQESENMQSEQYRSAQGPCIQGWANSNNEALCIEWPVPLGCEEQSIEPYKAGLEAALRAVCTSKSESYTYKMTDQGLVTLNQKTQKMARKMGLKGTVQAKIFRLDEYLNGHYTGLKVAFAMRMLKCHNGKVEGRVSSKGNFEQNNNQIPVRYCNKKLSYLDMDSALREKFGEQRFEFAKNAFK